MFKKAWTVLIAFLTGIVAAGCASPTQIYLSVEEQQAIAEVEGRVAEASLLFNRSTFKRRPELTVVRSPKQHIARFGLTWLEVPSIWPSQREAIKGEGYSGLWIPPDLYVSVIGGRDFRKLYAHERAHTFFPRGTAHSEEHTNLAKFLLGEL